MADPAGRKPNVVIVFMDDMGYGDMGCFGATAIKTPTMDAVAEAGIKFTQMYSAAPICTPSRCGLLTGRYAQRVGLPRVLFPKDTIGLTDREKTLADYLKTAGYATCCVGKWHLGCLPEHYPTRHGFDHYFGLLYSNDMDPLHLYRNEQAVETEVDQAQLTRRYIAEAIDFIAAHADQSFLLYLAHTMPHIPLHVEATFRGTSAGGLYGDTIECIDHYLSVLLAKLEELGMADETFVIVTSDNGPWFDGSTAGLRGRKFEVFEGGIRMPFVARWPGVIPPATVCGDPVSLMDLLPTLAHLAGVELSRERPIDGINIFPAFNGSPAPPREAFYYYTCDALNAVRVGKWKLHVAAGAKADIPPEYPRLYDMETDPGESYNQAAYHPQIVERLRGMIERFDAEVAAERRSHG